jgi:hypothetical protein
MLWTDIYIIKQDGFGGKDKCHINTKINPAIQIWRGEISAVELGESLKFGGETSVTSPNIGGKS